MIINVTRWGPGVFSYYHHWWIVPVIATHAGAVAGAWIYYLAIEVVVFVFVVVVVIVVVVVVVVAVVVVAGAWIYYLAIEVLQSFQLKLMMTASGWSCK